MAWWRVVCVGVEVFYYKNRPSGSQFHSLLPLPHHDGVVQIKSYTSQSFAVACGVVWCGAVWCGVVWCGMVRCGVMWCGVVWRGVV